MTDEDMKRLKEILFRFINRIAENKDATSAEVEALPKAASVLVEIYKTL